VTGDPLDGLLAGIGPRPKAHNLRMAEKRGDELDVVLVKLANR
jgi:hypothetical protein